MPPLLGRVRDIQPNAPRPTLELYFADVDRHAFARGSRIPVTLLVNGVQWRGTVASNSKNPVYLHSPLRSDIGTLACTELWLRLGLAEGAKLEFERQTDGVLRLVRIIDAGEWRPGNAPGQRTGGKEPRASRPSPAGRFADPRAETDFPFENREKIVALADLYWSLISPRDAEEERRFEREMPLMRQTGFLTKSLFVRIARWKSVRNTPNYESNDDAAVQLATRLAFRATEDAAALQALMTLHGVALRTASAILHWMRPERYPILDYRVVAALGEVAPTSYENVEYYEKIAVCIRRELAEPHGLDLRTIDRALWAWDKSRT